MRLTEHVKEKIKQHALEEQPRECCGIIISQGKKISVERCKNTSFTPEVHFKISPHDYVKCSNLGEIEAIYHSHPSGKGGLSIVDQQNSKITNQRFILYNVEDNKFIDSLEEEFSPYLGRDFELGVSDCVALMRDYYADNFNLKWKYSEIYPSREHYTTDEGKPAVKKMISFMKLYNFSYKGIASSSNELKKHDLIVTSAKPHENFPCHISIYMGYGKAIFQPITRKSCAVDYMSFLYEDALAIFRPNFTNE